MHLFFAEDNSTQGSTSMQTTVWWCSSMSTIRWCIKNVWPISCQPFWINWPRVARRSPVWWWNRPLIGPGSSMGEWMLATGCTWLIQRRCSSIAGSRRMMSSPMPAGSPSCSLGSVTSRVYHPQSTAGRARCLAQTCSAGETTHRQCAQCAQHPGAQHGVTFSCQANSQPESARPGGLSARDGPGPGGDQLLDGDDVSESAASYPGKGRVHPSQAHPGLRAVEA